MKKTTFISIFAVSMILVSCKKDPVTPNGGEVNTNTIIRGSLLESPPDAIDSVYAQATTGSETITLAKSVFEGNKFTLTLPTTIEDGHLVPISAADLIDIPFEVTISDESALVSSPLVFTAISKGEEVGSFTYGNLSSLMGQGQNFATLPTKGDAYISYIYANKSVSIKSTTPQITELQGIRITMNANLNLVSGWNQIAIILKDFSMDMSAGTVNMNIEASTANVANQRWTYSKGAAFSMERFAKSSSEFLHAPR